MLAFLPAACTAGSKAQADALGIAPACTIESAFLVDGGKDVPLPPAGPPTQPLVSSTCLARSE